MRRRRKCAATNCGTKANGIAIQKYFVKETAYLGAARGGCILRCPSWVLGDANTLPKRWNLAKQLALVNMEVEPSGGDESNGWLFSHVQPSHDKDEAQKIITHSTNTVNSTKIGANSSCPSGLAARYAAISKTHQSLDKYLIQQGIDMNYNEFTFSICESLMRIHKQVIQVNSLLSSLSNSFSSYWSSLKWAIFGL